MEENPLVFLAVVVLAVGAFLLLLRNGHPPADRDEPPTLDTRNDRDRK